jgi:putative transposase
MKRSRLSEEQIIGILKEYQAGLAAKKLCCRHGISDATFYKWRSKYGVMEVSDARRFKTPVSENAKLEKMLAEQMMDVVTLKEIPRKNTSEDEPCCAIGPSDNGKCSGRNAVGWAMNTKGYNQRRAFALAGIDPLVYRRLQLLLKREGWEVSWKEL